MKKSILVGIGVIVLAIGGIFFGSYVVKANNSNAPKLVTTFSESEIIAFKDTSIDINIKINTGIMKDDWHDTIKTKQNILNLANNEEKFEITNITGTIKNYKDDKYKDIKFNFNSKSVNLGEFEYQYNEKYATEGSTTLYELVGPELDIKLTIKPKILGDINLKDEITIKYEDGIGGSITNNPSNDCKITVGELAYNIDYITGEPQELRTVGLNRFFDLDYIINPGTLSVKSSREDNESNLNISEENFEDRDLIYVVDNSAIDLKGGNEEVARESIKKSLDELKKTNPDIQTSLVVYGEEAEIITIDEETKFSIDTLISAIDKIKSADKSGNLGDGIRKAKYLVNENYYTEISEGNTSMLETRVNKKGVNKKNKEKAKEYANNIVNDIAINEDDETRWYGINYGVEKEELLLNDLIDKFEGTISDVKKPYYDDFVSINEKATAPLIIKGILTVTSSANSGIVVQDSDKSKDIEFIFKKDTNGDGIDDSSMFVGQSQHEKIKIKIDKLPTTDYINVADPNLLEVKLTVDFDAESQEVIFNKRIEGDLKTELNPVTWLVKVEVPYIARVGLFNGRLDLTSLLRDSMTQEDIDYVYGVADKVLDNVSAPELAIENHYAFGMVIKTNTPSEIEGIIKKPINSNTRDEAIRICRPNCKECLEEKKECDDDCEGKNVDDSTRDDEKCEKGCITECDKCEKCVEEHEEECEDCDYCQECNLECTVCATAGECVDDCEICDDDNDDDEYEEVEHEGTLYILNSKNKFVPANKNGGIAKDDGEYKLKKDEIYLYVMNDYINTNQLDTAFEIGANIGDDDSKEFWGITVHPVPKPGHF